MTAQTFNFICVDVCAMFAADRDESENRLHWHLFKSNGSALVETRPAVSASQTTDVYLYLTMSKFIEMV